MKTHRPSTHLLVSLAFLMTAAVAFGQPASRLDVNDPHIEQAARALPRGAQLVLSGVELESGAATVDFEIERFRVFAPDAEIVVHGAAGDTTQPAPDNAYYRGTIQGVAGSWVVLTVRQAGGMRGLASQDGRIWVLGRGEAARAAASGLTAREIDLETELAGKAANFTCGTDDLAKPVDLFASNVARPLSTAPRLESIGESYKARIGIETDWEYFQIFGNTPDATDYAGDLIAFSSTIYGAEVDTALEVSHLSLWSAPGDPWAEFTTTCGLFEFGKYWNDNKSGVNRTIAHFMSGKNNGGGVAWVGVLCEPEFLYPGVGQTVSCSTFTQRDNYGGDYGYSGTLDGDFTIASPNVVWDIVVVSHEMGHNFNSPHTHCYEGLGGSGSAVDQCYGGQCGQSGCYCGGTSLPGPGCPGPGNGCGTIMSYCHLLSGGISNIGLTFGQGHPYGVMPERVPSRMNDFVVARDAAFPGCFAPTNQLPTAYDDAYLVLMNQTLVVSAPGVLGNDDDLDGDPLTAVEQTPTGDGLLSLAANGSFTYMPNTGFGGTDVFTYLANDGTGNSNVANAAIEICSQQNITLSSTISGSESHVACDTLTGTAGLEVTGSGDAYLRAKNIVFENGAILGGTVAAYGG